MLTIPPVFTRNRPQPETALARRGDIQVPSLAGEILLGGLIAAGVSLAIQRLMMFAPPASESAVPIALAVLGCSLLAGLVVVLLVRGAWPTWGTPAAWLVLAGISTGPQAATLNGTRYYLDGITADQSFRTEFLTRMTSSPRLADIAYADLPPFYPAGWFWVGGRFANLAGLPVWAAFKPFALLTFAVVAIVAFALWSRITTRRMALVLALITTLIGLANSAIEPYSWLASATIPPLAVLAWRWLTRLRQTGAIGDLGAVVVIGVALGLFGVTYTLLFGYFAVVLGLFAGVAVGLVWRRKLDREQSEPPPVPPGRVGRGGLVAAAVAAAISLAVLLPVWARTCSAWTGSTARTSRRTICRGSVRTCRFR